jgi:hypothetical protein
MAGTSVIPANLAARHRRWPAISSKPSLVRRTTRGWMMPDDFMLAASSAIDASLIVLRGWWGLGRMESIGIRRGVPAGAAVFGLDVGDGAASPRMISDSTGRFDIEIKLLKPRPRRGLFFVADDIGKDSFPFQICNPLFHVEHLVGKESTIPMGKQQRGGGEFRRVFEIRGGPHGAAVGVLRSNSFGQVSE